MDFQSIEVCNSANLNCACELCNLATMQFADCFSHAEVEAPRKVMNDNGETIEEVGPIVIQFFGQRARTMAEDTLHSLQCAEREERALAMLRARLASNEEEPILSESLPLPHYATRDNSGLLRLARLLGDNHCNIDEGGAVSLKVGKELAE